VIEALAIRSAHHARAHATHPRNHVWDLTSDLRRNILVWCIRQAVHDMVKGAVVDAVLGGPTCWVPLDAVLGLGMRACDVQQSFLLVREEIASLPWQVGSGGSTCCICLQPAELITSPVLLDCWHWTCWACTVALMTHKTCDGVFAECPQCRHYSPNMTRADNTVRMKETDRDMGCALLLPLHTVSVCDLQRKGLRIELESLEAARLDYVFREELKRLAGTWPHGVAAWWNMIALRVCMVSSGDSSTPALSRLLAWVKDTPLRMLAMACAHVAGIGALAALDERVYDVLWRELCYRATCGELAVVCGESLSLARMDLMNLTGSERRTRRAPARYLIT